MTVSAMVAASQASVIPRTKVVEIVSPWLLPEVICDSGFADRKVVYTMTNIVPNSIVAMAASANGSLYPGSMLTATGGDGGNLVNSKTGMPDQPDALSSADSIVVAGDVCSLPILASIVLTPLSISSMSMLARIRFRCSPSILGTL